MARSGSAVSVGRASSGQVWRGKDWRSRLVWPGVAGSVSVGMAVEVREGKVRIG